MTVPIVKGGRVSNLLPHLSCSLGLLTCKSEHRNKLEVALHGVSGHTSPSLSYHETRPQHLLFAQHLSEKLAGFSRCTLIDCFTHLHVSPVGGSTPILLLHRAWLVIMEVFIESIIWRRIGHYYIVVDCHLRSLLMTGAQVLPVAERAPDQTVSALW